MDEILKDPTPNKGAGISFSKGPLAYELSIATFRMPVLRFIAEGVATRDGVCAYDSFCTSKFLKTKGLLCMREDRLAACGTRSS